jgi:carboxylesterase type B
MKALSFLGFVLFGFQVGAREVNNDASALPTATIDSGIIIGTTTNLPSATAPVLKYLGIPYAEKPERFEPPKAPGSWQFALKTQKWQSACIQQLNG